MHVTTIGLDLAKNVFQVHGITLDDEVAFNRPLRRAQLLPFFSKLESLPDWYGGLQQCASLGTRVDEIWPRRSADPTDICEAIRQSAGKSDAIDAEAICEAVTRPTMRFVAIKTVEQQSLSVSPSCAEPAWFGSAPSSSMVCAAWSLNLVCISREVSLGSSVLPRTYWLAKFWSCLISRTR